ncbi:MAG: sugar nucleotide-binding protein [Bacilli bacterium]|nr:sugar nucleotide-binding protein [Bacilli bacterium]
MKKVLVLGGNGMAGHMITLFLKETNKYSVYNLCHKDRINKESIICDIVNLSLFKSTLEDIKPDIIINAIGILNDKSDENIAYTTYINTFIPKWLENYYKESKCKIIHLSTDCVFKGDKGSYSEDSLKDEENIYGISKNLGEINNKKDLTIRTSIIGPELKDGKGLFDWFMRQKKIVEGYTNVYWSGITTLELAHVIDLCIEKNITGLYNICSKSKISKHGLLEIILSIFEKSDINLIENNVKKSDKSLISKRSDLRYCVKEYRTMLEDMKAWMISHIGLYQKYFNNQCLEKKIIIWSKLKSDNFKNDEETEKWLEHRIKVFMKYTLNSFKRQTNQNFTYVINYDDGIGKFLNKELAKYPKLPDNVIFTQHYYREINEQIKNYKYLYFVRIDSDDMYHKDFIQKLESFKPKIDTKALIAQSGYIYDVNTNELGEWFYKSPPFYTLIYETDKFLRGYRYEIHGHSSVINQPHEIIPGNNFVVVIHGENTVSRFNTSFKKATITDPLIKQKILKDFNLRKIDEDD